MGFPKGLQEAIAEWVSSALFTLALAWMAMFLLSILTSFSASDLKVVHDAGTGEEQKGEEEEQEGEEDKEEEEEGGGGGEGRQEGGDKALEAHEAGDMREERCKEAEGGGVDYGAGRSVLVDSAQFDRQGNTILSCEECSSSERQSAGPLVSLEGGAASALSPLRSGAEGWQERSKDASLPASRAATSSALEASQPPAALPTPGAAVSILGTGTAQEGGGALVPPDRARGGAPLVGVPPEVGKGQQEGKGQKGGQGQAQGQRVGAAKEPQGGEGEGGQEEGRRKEQEELEEEQEDDWEGVETSELEERFDAAAALVVAMVGPTEPQSQGAGKGPGPGQVPAPAAAPGEGLQLLLYSLYKQATEGSCSTQQPPFYSFRARAKWDAWRQLGSMSTEEAMEKYVELVGEMSPAFREGLQRLGHPEDTDRESGKSGPGQGAGGGRSVSTFQDAEGQAEGEGEGGSEQSALVSSAAEGDVEALKAEILRLPQSALNDADEEGRTALHWAADRGQVAAVKLLLDAGVDANAQDMEGQTALHYAAVCEHEEVARVLLQRGASTSIPDTEGKTPAELLPPLWQ